RFPRVWAFHAWNMAYNISVAVPNADERWEWVKAGIELLRDEALVYNPNDVLIHKELAWLYVHKVQGFMDDANRYYKRALAREWTEILGTPPDLPDDTELAIETMVEWLTPIVEAPNTLERVIEQERRAKLEMMPIEDREKVTDITTIRSHVREIVETVEAAEGVALDESLLRLIAYQIEMERSWFTQDRIEEYYASLPNQPVVALMTDPDYTDAWERFIPHLRKRVLIDNHKLEPARMVVYTQRYGPLDWRHPATHAVYWASKGVEESLERVSTTERTYVNTDRIVVHALQELWRSGTIYFDFLSREGNYIARRNLHYTDSYGDVLEAIIRPRATTVDSTDRAFSLYSEGYENFQKEVIRVHYRLGNKQLADKYLKDLARSSWLNTNDPERWITYGELSLDEFVAKQLAEDRFTIPYVARTEITAAIEDGYLRGLLRGDTDKWIASYNYAKRVHRSYKQQQELTTLADRQAERMQELPPNIDEIAAEVFVGFIVSGQMQPWRARELWRGSPDSIKARAYDRLAVFISQSGMPKETFDLLFPEPPGVAAWRAELRRREAENRKIGVEMERDS
ncbi:MAG: hypothetical protein AAGH64_08655, partial [Planctomycetota bacterium]